MIANPFAGMFSIDPNSTPQQIAEQRARIAAMMPQFGNAKYVGQGLGQLATGIAMGMQNRKIDKIEGNNQQTANDMFSRIFGARDTQASTSGPSRGPLSVLGMQSPTDPNSSQGIATDAMTALGHNPQGEFSAALLDAGLPQHVVDGINMNVADESGFNPAAVGDNGNAFGLAQWNGPRKAALLKFAADAGMDPSSPKVQAQFLVSELRGPEAGAMAALTATQNAPDAAVAFLNKFERPAEQHRARREAAYGGQPAPQTAPPQIPMSDLYAVLSNSYSSPEQKAVATSLIEQNTQNADPMRAMELQKAQLELDQMQNPQQGGGEYGLQPIVTQDADGKYHLFQAAKDGSAPKEIALPFGWTPGNQYLDTGTAFQPVPKVGTGAGAPIVKDVAGAAAEAERGKNTAAAEQMLPATQTMVDTIDQQITDLQTDPYLPNMLGPMDSRLPNISEESARVQGKIDQLKGGVFLQARQMLKGGGAITDYEGQKAEQAFARMNQAQSVADFNSALDDFRYFIKQGLKNLDKQAGGSATQPGQTLTYNPDTGEFE